jgi:hypothetical protein
VTNDSASDVHSDSYIAFNIQMQLRDWGREMNVKADPRADVGQGDQSLYVHAVATRHAG